MTTALGLTMIAISAVAASCQEAHAGNLALVVLGGIGMGLVRLQVKMIKHCSGNGQPLAREDNLSYNILIDFSSF